LAVQVRINEWLAGNATTLADPADGDFEDWFELYNAGENTVNLNGYTLTDNLTNTAKFKIPAGVTLAPHGFLLVWADDETRQNRADRDLHVNFKLGLGGEAIGLFAPNGTMVDTVEFGPQTDDVSRGRWPDGGSTPFYFMTKPSPAAANLKPDVVPAGLRITDISASGESVTITWAAQAGKTYVVQSRQSLSAGSWTALGSPVVAYQPTASYTDATMLIQPERYYRIVEQVQP
jgi:hypothetical protein